MVDLPLYLSMDTTFVCVSTHKASSEKRSTVKKKEFAPRFRKEANNTILS